MKACIQIVAKLTIAMNKKKFIVVLKLYLLNLERLVLVMDVLKIY